jgi:hypothetical protein
MLMKLELILYNVNFLINIWNEFSQKFTVYINWMKSWNDIKLFWIYTLYMQKEFQ